MSRAVVFAYHNVGVRCLKALLGAGVEVALVVTHQDQPGEDIWFDSVQALAAQYALPTITPDDPNDPAIVGQIAALAPDFLFSFYYRKMLKAPLLATASQGAFNMHGSLLPKYRGRVPINWAVLHGERETGASLHVMNVKPDNGPLIDQCAIPILPDDTAAEVFDKVVVAAEIVLCRSLPALMAGTARRIEQDLQQGGYFGGRTAEDGRISAMLSAGKLHDFVRALSRPYPGAFTDIDGRGRLILWKTRCLPDQTATAHEGLMLFQENDKLYCRTHDGGLLLVLDAELNGAALDASAFAQQMGPHGKLLISYQPEPREP